MSQTLSVEEAGGTASPKQTIEVHGISDALLQRLDQRARESGRDRSQVIQAILTKELGGEDTEFTARSFEAALAPIRQGFAESGLSEDEATAMLEEGLRATRQNKRSGRAEPQSSTQQDDIKQVGTENGRNGR